MNIYKKIRQQGRAFIVVMTLLAGVLVFSSPDVRAGVYGAGYYGECAYGEAGVCVGPSGVQNLTLTPGNNAITATWQAPADDGGSTILGYIVQISDDGGTSWSTAVTTTSLTYTFPGLNPSVTYRIRVAAYNAIDQSAFVVASGRPAFITLSLPPSSPTILIASGATTLYSSMLFAPTVETNISYAVSLSSNSNATDLVNGGDTIAASAGTMSSPVTLVSDTWGYRVDGAGSFGAGPTTATNQSTTLAGSWAGVPDVLNADTVGSGTVTSGQAINIWFAVGIPPGKTPGSYTQTILITAAGS